MGVAEEPPAFDALQLPPAVLDRGGIEVLRAIIVDGELQVSLRHAFEDPDPWGMLIADLTRHIAEIYASKGGMTPEQVIARVRAAYKNELAGAESGSASANS